MLTYAIKHYYYSLDGNILIGTTTTGVPVKYTRPSELEFDPIPFTYDQTDPANPVLKYVGSRFVYTLRGERAGRVLSFLKPSGALFAGHTLSAFVQTQDGLSNLDIISANQSGGFWHTDLAANKPSLLDKGDTQPRTSPRSTPAKPSTRPSRRRSPPTLLRRSISPCM